MPPQTPSASRSPASRHSTLEEASHTDRLGWPLAPTALGEEAHLGMLPARCVPMPFGTAEQHLEQLVHCADYGTCRATPTVARHEPRIGV